MGCVHPQERVCIFVCFFLGLIVIEALKTVLEATVCPSQLFVPSSSPLSLLPSVCLDLPFHFVSSRCHFCFRSRGHGHVSGTSTGCGFHFFLLNGRPCVFVALNQSVQVLVHMTGLSTEDTFMSSTVNSWSQTLAGLSKYG